VKNNCEICEKLEKYYINEADRARVKKLLKYNEYKVISLFFMSTLLSSNCVQ